MAWHQIGAKPLSKPKMTQIINIHIYATDINELNLSLLDSLIQSTLASRYSYCGNFLVCVIYISKPIQVSFTWKELQIFKVWIYSRVDYCAMCMCIECGWITIEKLTSQQGTVLLSDSPDKWSTGVPSGLVPVGGWSFNGWKFVG